MSNSNKLTWLKRILVVKVLFTFLFWGLPLLIMPAALLQRFGVPASDTPIYLRLLGAVITALGLAYWYAYKDPVRNIAILKAGIVDNGLVFLVTLYFMVFHGLRGVTFFISAPLTLFFCIAFILLMPKEAA
jgi:hypothetical protein